MVFHDDSICCFEVGPRLLYRKSLYANLLSWPAGHGDTSPGFVPTSIAIQFFTEIYLSYKLKLHFKKQNHRLAKWNRWLLI